MLAHSCETELHESQSRKETTSQESNESTVQILLKMLQQDENEEENRKVEENRREDQRRFERLILELKRSSDESQERLMSRIERWNVSA